MTLAGQIDNEPQDAFNRGISMKMNRRMFLARGAAMAVLQHGVTRSLLPALEMPFIALSHDPRRPQFHLMPAKNWMNDPNGPIYFNGNYHMFCQYNPRAAVWGDMSWYHSVSPDMIHWKHLPIAMTPTPDSPDSFGCFSGSAIQVGQRVYQIYTGTKIAPKELATIRDGEDRIQESQCVAYSDDPLLIKWTKMPKPIIPLPPAGMKITGFRDPSAWKQGDWYYMTVGSGVAEIGGCVLLYRSREIADAQSWEYMHELTSGKWDGKKTANPCDDGEMWECPDFFALDGRHVLIYSTLGKVFWQSGELDTAEMKFHPKKTGELDLGAFYAPKTQLDADGRRILWGWIKEERSDDAMRAAGWSGMMSLPRVLNLDKEGSLVVTTLPELDKLRAGSIYFREDQATLPGASGEVLFTAASADKLELTLKDGAKNLLHASYSGERHCWTVGDKEVLLEAGDSPSFHAFVDASVVEVILSKRIGYTRRFYFEGSTAPEIKVEASSVAGNGLTLKAWKVSPISDNRLTTPAAGDSA
jgi:beta-fructofuranosidase